MPVERETDEHPAGTIFVQVPSAGTQVPGGTLLTVEVAVAPPAADVPNVIGLTEAEAKQTATGLGFGVDVEIVQNPEPDGEQRPGRVWAQDPSPDTPGDGIDTVRLRVNPEPEPEPDPEDD